MTTPIIPARALWLSLTLCLACGNGGGLTVDGGQSAPATGDAAAPIDDAAAADRPLPLFEALPVIPTDASADVARDAAADAPAPALDLPRDLGPDRSSDLAAPVPDTASVAPDTAPVPPDTAPVPPDTASVQPDTAPVPADAAPLSPDTAPLSPDTAPPSPDTAPLSPDAAPDLAADTAPIGTVIFSDDFESGNLSRWGASSGSPMVTAGCARAGNLGLRLDIDPIARITVGLPAPPRTRVRVRARVDFGNYSYPTGTGFHTFMMLKPEPNIFPDVASIAYAPSDPTARFRASLAQQGGTYRRIIHDRALAPGAHLWQLDWYGASQAGAADGSMTFLVDGLPGQLEPATVSNETTVSGTTVTLYFGFAHTMGTGHVCLDDVEVIALP